MALEKNFDGFVARVAVLQLQCNTNQQVKIRDPVRRQRSKDSAIT